jgi:copper type II ascorbate-dependent monooxygenase-like protein
MKRYLKRMVLASIAAGSMSACADDTSYLLGAPMGGAPNVEDADSLTGGPDSMTGALRPTFYEDMAPIFGAKCVSCHQAGGIAPFALNDYDAARARAQQIADYTRDRIMPPFGIETGGECGSFDESIALTQDEIDVIGSWARGERREGTPVALPLPQLPELALATDFPLPEFSPVIQGGPLAAFDEYRCFLLDTPRDADTFITGYDVQPGNSALVHHVLVFIVDPALERDGRTNAQTMQALHDADPNPARDGWSCFGMAGDGVSVESVPVTWGPGQGIVSYPSGVGVALQRDRQLVVQVHYNMAGAAAPGQTDQSLVRLRLAPEVERQAIFILEDPLLDGLVGGNPTVLQPGLASEKYTWSRSGQQMGLPPGVPAELISFLPHMHGRGRKFTFELANGDDFACAGRVNNWDFNWQRLYHYAPALPFTSDSRVRVTCDYSTLGDTDVVLPGWSTDNEMCLATLVLALPPGVSF